MGKEWSVYIHTNLFDGKRYIGITSQIPERRWRNGYGYTYNPYFWNAICKYGWNSFSHEIVLSGMDEKSAKDMESNLIMKYNTTNEMFGYNLTHGGDGTVGRVVSDATKKKISDAHIGKQHTEETKKKISHILIGNQYAKGYHHTDATKHSISNSLRGNQCAKGFKHSEETRLKMSNAHKGMSMSKESKEKLSNALKGRHISDETKEKISKANKGKISRAIAVDMFTLDGVFVRSFISAKDATRALGIDNSQIIKACKGKQKSSGGYMWRYHEKTN